jgi:hypothetical protein
MSRLILPPGVAKGNARRYCGRQGEDYMPPSVFRYRRVSILPDLIGKYWDDAALNLCHSARPSMIRVTCGEETTDSVLWRVTVRTNAKGVIEQVTQEAEVGG